MSFHRKLLPKFLVLLILLWVVPNVLGTQIDIVATADSYTSNINPDANYGGSEFLDTYYCTYEFFGENFTQAYVTWLKFNLSVIPSEATVSSIILRMHTSLIGPIATNKIGVFLCSDSNWEEMTIDWNNSPQVTGAPISTAFVGTGNKDYDFNVSSAVKDKSIVTLVLKTLESTSLGGSATFYSREQPEADYRPRLVVEYSSPSSPLDLVPRLLILVVVVAVVVFATYFVMHRRKQRSPPNTP